MKTTKIKAAGQGTRAALKKSLHRNHTTGTACLKELHALVWRFSALGIGVDIASMALIEFWCVFYFLRRVAGSEA
jgi:hypothetical protein